jgi:hypothetical protein
VGHGVDRNAGADGSGSSLTPIEENLIDAKGDLIVGSADNAADNLTVGANDRILMADSAQTLGVKWATPAEVRTALDVPTTGESILDTIIAAKGDLIVGTANDTPAVLSVGATDGHVLTVLSSEASGLVYRSPYRKNAIINGDFNVWQRGTSFAAAVSGAYSADRWRWENPGAGAFTLSRSTDVPTFAQAGRLFNYSLLADCTTADAAVAATDRVHILQRIEGFNFLPLAQRAMTLTFWVKATKTGTYCVSFTNGGSDRSYVAEYTISASDTWEKKTVNVSASPSAGTWDYTTGVGLDVDFILVAGTDFHTTAGAWQTGAFKSTAYQVNGADRTANNFRITGVQLETGSIATEFEYRTFQDELALCQRYYEKTFDYGTVPAQGVDSNAGALMSNADTTTGPCVSWRFIVPKRASAATITTYNPWQANANWRDFGDTVDETVGLEGAGNSGVAIRSTTNVNNGRFVIHATADSEL